MKRSILASASAVTLGFTLLATIAPSFAADVRVSVDVGQPGFYGRIDIGDYPQPQVIYRQPVVIERREVEQAPVYLRVPPGHAKNWRKHCGKYNACGERVYFVKDDWYQREYVPRHQEREHGRRDGDGDRDKKGESGGKANHGKHGN